MAQSVERPSKVPIWCGSAELGSNPGAAILGGRKDCCEIAAPSMGQCRDKGEEWEKKMLCLKFEV